MLTYDRYLLRSFAHVFIVCFIAMFGLMVVIDLLENLDEFLNQNADSGVQALLETIARYYACQSILFLDRAGPSLTLIAVVVVLILFQRSGELYPMLAAGIPMFRVLLPLVFAAGCVSGLLVLNQELVIPRIAHSGIESRGGAGASDVRVEPVYDYASRISINGRRMRLSQRSIEDAEFVLPAPTIVGAMGTVKSPRAIHRSAKNGRPAGWILEDVSTPWSELSLTADGKRVVLLGPRPQDLFIVTAVTCDQLYKRNSSFTMLSTQELLRRVQSPAFGTMSSQRLVAYLHSRFVQPLMNVISVLLVIPLMVRRESTGLVADSAVSATILGTMFGLTQASLYCGQVQLIPADLAAWIPVVIGGSWAAWLSGVLKT